MCRGFKSTRNSLIVLNMLYTLISCVIIGIGAYSRMSSIVTNIEAVQVLIGCGIFLAILSLMGLIGAAKHHQVLLFFYMLILFIIFLVQFAIACACLAVTDEQRIELAAKGWQKSSNHTRNKAQNFFSCCGFDERPSKTECMELSCCTKESCDCPVCRPKIVRAISKGLDISGKVGLLFSFTEFLGVWLTIRYRNQKNPRARPSPFL